MKPALRVEAAGAVRRPSSAPTTRTCSTSVAKPDAGNRMYAIVSRRASPPSSSSTRAVDADRARGGGPDAPTTRSAARAGDVIKPNRPPGNKGRRGDREYSNGPVRDRSAVGRRQLRGRLCTHAPDGRLDRWLGLDRPGLDRPRVRGRGDRRLRLEQPPPLRLLRPLRVAGPGVAGRLGEHPLPGRRTASAPTTTTRTCWTWATRR